MARAMAGQPPYAWEPKSAYVGVKKRKGAASDIVWFRAENCYVFHVMNAWEAGDRIIADVMQFERRVVQPSQWLAHRSEEVARTLVPLELRSRRNTDRFTQTYLDDITGEFPRIDDRRAGLVSRHGWYAAPIPICRCSARSPAWCMSMARERGLATICCRRRHHL